MVSSMNRESYRSKGPCHVHRLENLVWRAASQQSHSLLSWRRVPVLWLPPWVCIVSVDCICSLVHFQEVESWMGASSEAGSRRVRVWLRKELLSVLVRTIVSHFWVQYKRHIWDFFQLPRISLRRNDRWQFLKRKKKSGVLICIWRTLGKMSAPAVGRIIHSLSRKGKDRFCFLVTESVPALYCRWYVGKPDPGISLLDASTASTWVFLGTTAPLIHALLQLRGLLCSWSDHVTFHV